MTAQRTPCRWCLKAVLALVGLLLLVQACLEAEGRYMQARIMKAIGPASGVQFQVLRKERSGFGLRQLEVVARASVPLPGSYFQYLREQDLLASGDSTANFSYPSTLSIRYDKERNSREITFYRAGRKVGGGWAWAVFALAGLLPGLAAYLTRAPRAHEVLLLGLVWSGVVAATGYTNCASSFEQQWPMLLGAVAGLGGMGAVDWWGAACPRPGQKTAVVAAAVVSLLIVAGGWIGAALCHFSLF